MCCFHQLLVEQNGIPKKLHARQAIVALVVYLVSRGWVEAGRCCFEQLVQFWRMDRFGSWVRGLHTILPHRYSRCLCTQLCTQPVQQRYSYKPHHFLQAGPMELVWRLLLITSYLKVHAGQKASILNKIAFTTKIKFVFFPFNTGECQADSTICVVW